MSRFGKGPSKPKRKSNSDERFPERRSESRNPGRDGQKGSDKGPGDRVKKRPGTPPAHDSRSSRDSARDSSKEPAHGSTNGSSSNSDASNSGSPQGRPFPGSHAGSSNTGSPGEGRRRHRKGLPPASGKSNSKGGPHRKTPHGGPAKEFNADRGDSGKRDLPQANIEKSHLEIKTWLAAGADLRSQNAARPSGPTDPKTLTLDPWQQQVFDLLRAGESVIVDAPTTAGKTRAVEVFFAMNIDDPNFRAAYTTPVKSLSNDKVRELRAMFGDDKIGIATGDIKENLDAPIVVATLESYRNSLLGIEPDLGRTLVVFDEYHYLQDEGRGSAWEEAIILTPPSCQVLLLSASVGNAEDFAEWISTQGKKRCTLVRTEIRPVPLANIIHYGGQWLTEANLPKEAFSALNPTRRELPLHYEDLVTRLPSLIDLDLVPCIIYCGKRFDCENLAVLLERTLQPLPPEQSEKIGAVLMQAHKDIGSLTFIKPALRRMIQTYGVGYHHSGLAPAARIAIERLVKDGLLRFCVATMGLSLGINFSVRSSIIADYQRPGENGMTAYAEGEILQMLGRAGRRGKDVIGFSIWPSIEAFVRQGNSKREPCNSRLRTDPTTLLGLIGRGLNLSTVEGIYGKSFLKYQQKKTDLRLIRKPDVENKLGSTTLPCVSPAAEYARFKFDEKLEQPTTDTECRSCPLVQPCHNYLDFRRQAKLTGMHLHLHQLGGIAKDETLTPMGSIARYFPQSGGLLISSMLIRGMIVPEKLVNAAELMAALCLPRFKEPGGSATYKFPFDSAKLESELQVFYPQTLFPEVYDNPFGRRTWYQIKEFNPAAGWIVRQWLTGMDWQTLVKEGTTEYFGVGDLMGLMYRVATYLQSLAAVPGFKDNSYALRRELLRTPLDLTF
jgi:DEAD/DEAH box helicase